MNMKEKSPNLKEKQSPGIPDIRIIIEEVSVFTTLSVRMLDQLMKDESFPKLKIGKRLVFNMEAVIAYLTHKYGRSSGL